jgi:hypothetical protein
MVGDTALHLGDRARRLSLRSAYKGNKQILDQLLRLVFEAVAKAADAGCRFCSKLVCVSELFVSHTSRAS